MHFTALLLHSSGFQEVFRGKRGECGFKEGVGAGKKAAAVRGQGAGLLVVSWLACWLACWLAVKSNQQRALLKDEAGRKEATGVSTPFSSLSLFCLVCLFVVLLLLVLLLLSLLLLLLLWLLLLLVDVLTADDLVNDPVENVKNEEDEREGHAGHGVNALGPADEELLHLLDAFLGCRRGRGVVVVALDGHAVLGVQAGGAHTVAWEAEASLARLVLLQHRPRLSLVGATGTQRVNV